MYSNRHSSRILGALVASALVAACATAPKVDEQALLEAQAPPPEPTAEERVGLATQAFAQGDCESVRTHADKALEKEPDNAQAEYLLGRCDEQKADFASAIERYKRVLAKDPDHEDALLSIGQGYKRTGEYDAAIALYKDVLERDPENVKIRNNLGVIYRLAGQYDLAEAAFRRVLARKQGDVEAYKNFVVLYMAQDKLVLAEQFSLEARKLKEDDAGIWTNLGLIRFKRDPSKPTAALDAFFKAVELDPNAVEAHENIAAIALRYRDYGVASKHAAQAVALEPNNWQARLALAYALDGERKVDEAVAAYDKALSLRSVTDEVTADVLWSKAMLYKSTQNWANTREMLVAYRDLQGVKKKHGERIEGELQGVDYMLSLNKPAEPAPSIGTPSPAAPAPEPEPEAEPAVAPETSDAVPAAVQAEEPALELEPVESPADASAPESAPVEAPAEVDPIPAADAAETPAETAVEG